MILSDTELRVCRHLGRARHDTARESNVTDVQVGDQDAYQIDVDGMVGEMVVAKHLNLFPDLTVGARSGGADLVSKSGKTIDVKATRYKTGKLVVTKKKKEESCDCYILVVVNDSGGEIKGWARKDDVFRDENLGDLGRGEGYILPQGKLRRM